MKDRIQELKNEIAERLRHVMPAIPEKEFEQLIDQMARIQYKYEAMEHDRVIQSLLPKGDEYQD